MCGFINYPSYTSPLDPKGGGGGSTSLCGLYRFVRPLKVWFCIMLVVNRVLIEGILDINRVRFMHSTSLDIPVSIV